MSDATDWILAAIFLQLTALTYLPMQDPGDNWAFVIFLIGVAVFLVAVVIKWKNRNGE